MPYAWDLTEYLNVGAVTIGYTGAFDRISYQGNKIKFDLKFKIRRSDKDEGFDCSYVKEYTFAKGLEKILGQTGFKALPEAVKAVFTRAMTGSFGAKVKELENGFRQMDTAIKARIESELGKSQTDPPTVSDALLRKLTEFRKREFDQLSRIFAQEMNKRMDALFYWCVEEVLKKLAPKDGRIRNISNSEIALKAVGVGLVITVVVLSFVLLAPAAAPAVAAVGAAAAITHTFTALNIAAALHGSVNLLKARGSQYLTYWKTADKELKATNASLEKAVAALQMLIASNNSLGEEMAKIEKTIFDYESRLAKAKKDILKMPTAKKYAKVARQIDAYEEALRLTRQRYELLLQLADQRELDRLLDQLMRAGETISSLTNNDAATTVQKLATGLDGFLGQLGKLFDVAAITSRTFQIVGNAKAN